mmetsp:Transcript_3110/g.4769  ORF Transcript_3110/g.4769 Transcript_3110/m.4769 type:complete len:271 (-) Transcript_3110:68-880(-)|eukprot:CAMPEP_0171455334 /NCGR_PEP_ID=MMETSP0945-20130129/2272_1 /TAXON_ID=109269 /ORGANISM="Vaucheria litorea, Strain CCMP2940" /LENGTH=270 /DNA_ID=CAMNT_0011980557 /DNA_START=96 /DNA_END=908 /DNA_ORIENTATION=-
MSEIQTAERVTDASSTKLGDEILEDGYPANLEIPIRYIKGMDYDMTEARRRWIESLKWRESYKVDNMLEEPQLHFDAIKKYYPHYVSKTSKEGHLVYYEIPGKTDLKSLRKNGVDIDQLIRHYIYITEFIWKELDKNEEAKLLTIMDLKGVSISQFAGEVREYMVRAAKLIGAHYPERSFKIFVLNAPWWFNMVWKVLSPLMHANTKAKVTVCGGEYMDKLKELIDEENIPLEIGGKDESGGLKSPQEVALKRHVDCVLQASNLTQPPTV